MFKNKLYRFMRIIEGVPVLWRVRQLINKEETDDKSLFLYVQTGVFKYRFVLNIYE
jgi:hypothetical protein